MRGLHWQVGLGLIGLYLAIFLECTWVWGLLLLVLAAVELYQGETWLLRRVTLDRNPVLFFLLSFHWLFFGFYFFADLPLALLSRI